MSYPQLRIDLKKLSENAGRLAGLLKEKGIRFHYVTKCFCAYEPMVRALADAGFRDYADSRLENLEALGRYARSRLLVRIPMISEASAVVCLADISLNSELETIRALSDAALTQGRVHGVILMVELGDLREGVMPEDVRQTVSEILELKGVRLRGVGVNFNCYGGVIPDRGKMERLIAVAEALQSRYGLEMEFVSGGNSGSLYLILNGDMPKGISHLRIGEGLLLGRETSFGDPIPNLHPDVFSLRCEVVECRLKPSLPDGKQGLNAAGERPYFEDRGTICRAILAIGGQDVATTGLTPLMPGVDFLGNSSDHAIFDVTHAERGVRVGDTLDFAMNYKALNGLFASRYVHKAPM